MLTLHHDVFQVQRRESRSRLCNYVRPPLPKLGYLFYKFETLWFFDAEGVTAFGALDFASTRPK